MAATGAKAADRAPPPPTSRQKTFIVENAGILNKDTKKDILRIVMMEVGKEVAVKTSDGETVQTSPVVLENRTTQEVSINLDHVDSVEVIHHIYNIVNNRRISLNEPAHGGKH